MRIVVIQDGRRAFFHAFAGLSEHATAIVELFDGKVLEIEAHGIQFEQQTQQEAE